MSPPNGTLILRQFATNMMDPIAAGQMRDLLANVSMQRQNFMTQLMDPRRDLDAECGYPKSVSAYDFQNLYDTFAPAARVTDLFPDECWLVTPEVFETEDVEMVTPFEEAWDYLPKMLKPESYFQDEIGSPIWDWLHRLDRATGIGQFAVMLVGIDDGLELDKPAFSTDEKGNVIGTPKPHELTFLRVFPEVQVQVIERETRMTNRRFGQPTMYNITFEDPKESQQTGIGYSTETRMVHWTRIIHSVDTYHSASSSEVFSPSRMRPVLPNLLDLKKLYGGSAEMYWRGAFPGMTFETHPQLGGDVNIDAAAMRSDAEQMMNGLQRYMLLSGMSAKTHAPTVSDPTPQIKVQLEAMCIKLAIPMRIFLGSERGELSSSQDDGQWNDRLAGRMNRYLTPRQICPFIDRLIAMGVLPAPIGYSIKWPDLNSLTEAEQADIMVKRTQAMTQYKQGALEDMMDPKDFYVREMHYTDEEAESILENCLAHMEEIHPDSEEDLIPGHTPAPPAPELPPGMPGAMGPDGKPLPGAAGPPGKPGAPPFGKGPPVAGGKKKGPPPPFAKK